MATEQINGSTTITPGKGDQGLVISDLHLFAERSDGLARFDGLRNRFAGLEVLVLNGDTFDFRWSVHVDHEATQQAAVTWLRGVIDAIPQGRVYLILGNHDCVSSFTQCLEALATKEPRFAWHEHHLRLGHHLFLHGDCTQWKMDPEGLARYRRPWTTDHQRGTLRATAYTWVDRLGFTRLVHAWHFPHRRTVERLVHYLDRACPHWRNDTRSCYFGHTHRPFSHYDYDGVTFHNTGSAIRHMDFNPMSFHLAGSPPEGTPSA